MRIAQVITEFSPFGAESIGYRLAESVAENRVESLVLAVRRYADITVEAKIREKLEQKGIKTVVLNATRCVNLIGYTKAAFSLMGKLRKAKINLLHSHTDIPDYVVAVGNIIASIPVIRTIHNTEIWPGRTIAPAIIERLLRPKTDVAVSPEALADWGPYMKRLGLRRKSPPILVPNEIDVPGGFIEPELARRELALRPDKHHCVFIGRLVEQKGFDLILEAVNLPNWPKDLVIHVYGAGHLESRIASVNQSRLYYHGISLDIARYLKAFEFILMPSRFEGLPLVLLEARAAGIPIVASSCRGIKGQLGLNHPYYIEPLSSNEIVSKLSLLDQLKNGECLSTGAAQVGMVERYLTLYEHHIDTRLPRREL